MITKTQLVIQRRLDLLLGGEVWRDAYTPRDTEDAIRRLGWIQDKHGADNVRLVRYVTTMEVVDESGARHA